MSRLIRADVGRSADDDPWQRSVIRGGPGTCGRADHKRLIESQVRHSARTSGSDLRAPSERVLMAAMTNADRN